VVRGRFGRGLRPLCLCKLLPSFHRVVTVITPHVGPLIKRTPGFSHTCAPPHPFPAHRRASGCCELGSEPGHGPRALPPLVGFGTPTTPHVKVHTEAEPWRFLCDMHSTEQFCSFWCALARDHRPLHRCTLLPPSTGFDTTTTPHVDPLIKQTPGCLPVVHSS
jgi:hypothetical protein